MAPGHLLSHVSGPRPHDIIACVYACAQPIIALVIPRVICRDHKWVLTGLASARQTLVNRGALLRLPTLSGHFLPVGI